ncbi:MAG: AbrB/MazE/SpoVT family DNA-binding domain-containing protein [Lachnospiraceae bacterium]|nr:AbrB/MazE/SpoVT family DNA-binding domain-containing protein [Lachnospiraceae bacterium]
MPVRVKVWGNGQGVRFSKKLPDTLDIHLDEYLNVCVADGDIVLSKSFKHKTLEERAAVYGGKTGAYEELSWGEALGRETW